MYVMTENAALVSQTISKLGLGVLDDLLERLPQIVLQVLNGIVSAIAGMV